jgi:hypothetical protein
MKCVNYDITFTGWNGLGKFDKMTIRIQANTKKKALAILKKNCLWKDYTVISCNEIVQYIS